MISVWETESTKVFTKTGFNMGNWVLNKTGKTGSKFGEHSRTISNSSTREGPASGSFTSSRRRLTHENIVSGPEILGSEGHMRKLPCLQLLNTETSGEQTLKNCFQKTS